MSIVNCQRCCAYVDSDNDVECFVDNGDYIACERCRERMEEAGELDVETNTTRKLIAVGTINGEPIREFFARMEASAEEPT